MAPFFSAHRSAFVQRQAETSALPEEKEEVQQKPFETTVQRMCAGCEAEQQEKSTLQPKLDVGQAGDPYEREADVISRRVAPLRRQRHIRRRTRPEVKS